MASTLDIDPTFKHALKLLHSPHSDATEKIRNLLDELIKQRYGSGKTLINTLSKKHLGEEPLAGGSNLYVRKQKVIEPKPIPVINLDPDPEPMAGGTIECIVSAPEALTMPPMPSGSILISTSDLEGNDEDDDVVMEEDKLKELEDLMCVVCRLMDVSARNRLVECADCHALYHQECHKPVISEADANDEENAWYCTLCRNKQTVTKLPVTAMVSTPPITIATSPSPTISSSASKATSHSKSASSKSAESSSSSSSSSSSKHKSSKSGSKSSDSSHERDRDRDRDRGERERDRERDRDRDRDRDRERERDRDRSSKSSSNSGGGGSSSSSGGAGSAASGAVGTPSINIISADKRLQMMKKKAAKMQDSKRKHK
ncbi:integrator complex subunit 12-like [Anopheles maculipalpis]|uniref:integrator complex subunit 12-like n=1 Tax=Anopheles maculipalpis TaxID=1496333 RepID=UPI002158C8F8|nr:integrator complex subunit 12-like [Anopheles maculipalpis]